MNLPTLEESVNEDIETDSVTETNSNNGERLQQRPTETATASKEEPKNSSVLEEHELIFNQDDLLNEIPKPLDGGYGWIIVFSSFFLSGIVEGLSAAYGIFHESLTIYFETNIASVSWIGSLLPAMSWMMGPFSSALINGYGFRIAAIAGSVLTAMAIILGTLSPNIGTLIFTHGILGGIGMSLIRFAANLSVGYYFSTKRALATGISFCGSGIGIFIFAPLLQALLDIYGGWREASILLSGIILNGVVFGALLRPLTYNNHIFKESSQEISEISRKSSIIIKSNAENRNVPRFSIVINNKATLIELGKLDGKLNNSSRDGSKSANRRSLQTEREDLYSSPNSDESNGIAASSLTPNRKGRMSICLDSLPRKSLSPLDVAINVNTNRERKDSVNKNSSLAEHPRFMRRMAIDRTDLNRPLYRKDIFYRGNISNLPQYRNSIVDTNSYLTAVTTIPLNEDRSEEDIKEGKYKLLAWFKLHTSVTDILEGLFDASFLKNVLYVCLCIANVLASSAYFLPFRNFSQKAIRGGIDPEIAVVLISVMGISNAIGKFALGPISTLPRVSALYIHNTALLLSGISIFSMPFTYRYITMIFSSLAYGFFSAGHITTTTLVLVDILGLEKLTDAFGLLGFFRGFGLMIGPPIAENIVLWTGNSDASFFFAGALYVLSPAMMLLGSQCQGKKSNPPPEENEIHVTK